MKTTDGINKIFDILTNLCMGFTIVSGINIAVYKYLDFANTKKFNNIIWVAGLIGGSSILGISAKYFSLLEKPIFNILSSFYFFTISSSLISSLIIDKKKFNLSSDLSDLVKNSTLKKHLLPGAICGAMITTGIYVSKYFLQKNTSIFQNGWQR